MLTRRMLLSTALPAAGLLVTGCTSTQMAQAQQDWSNFVDEVNQTLAAGCSTIVPAFTATVNTVEAVVGVLYPSIAAAIAAGATAVTAVAGKICGAVPTSPPAAQSLKRKLLSTQSGVAVTIGNIVVNGKTIPIQGYPR